MKVVTNWVIRNANLGQILAANFAAFAPENYGRWFIELGRLNLKKGTIKAEISKCDGIWENLVISKSGLNFGYKEYFEQVGDDIHCRYDGTPTDWLNVDMHLLFLQPRALSDLMVDVDGKQHKYIDLNSHKYIQENKLQDGTAYVSDYRSRYPALGGDIKFDYQLQDLESRMILRPCHEAYIQRFPKSNNLLQFLQTRKVKNTIARESRLGYVMCASPNGLRRSPMSRYRSCDISNKKYLTVEHNFEWFNEQTLALGTYTLVGVRGYQTAEEALAAAQKAVKGKKWTRPTEWLPRFWAGDFYSTFEGHIWLVEEPKLLKPMSKNIHPFIELD